MSSELEADKRNFGKIAPAVAVEEVAFGDDQAEGLRRILAPLETPTEQAAKLYKVANSGTDEGIPKLPSLTGLEDSHFKTGRTIAITSGKGGVGKSNISVNLALALSGLGKKVVLVDLDLGLANADILLDIESKYNLSHIISANRTLDEIVVKTSAGLSVVTGASGVEKLANLGDVERERLIMLLAKLGHSADYIIFDTSAGISKNTIAFVASTDDVIIVTTPEPTAIVDAYAVLKMITQADYGGEAHLVMNMVRDRAEHEKFSDAIATVAKRFLNAYIDKLGYVVSDPHIPLSVRARKPFYLAHPRSDASHCIRKLASTIVNGKAIQNNRPNFIARLFGALR